MTNEVQIYFDDLTPEAQAEVLKASGSESGEDFNDSPLAILEYE